MKRAVLVLFACLAAVPAPTARADEAVAEVLRESPIAAYGGWSAYSRSVGFRYQLVFRSPQGETVVPTLETSSRPWDVSLGPDENSNVVAVYKRCFSDDCEIRRLSTASGRVTKLTAVDSPDFREATPAIWRDTVVFTRRIRGCDVPYVKRLSSRAPSRRLLRSKCVQTAPGHTAIRGTRIVVSSVDLSQADENGAGRKTSEVRRYSAKTSGPGSAVLLRQGFGEESNRFGQVAIDEHHVTTVRYGVRQPHAFVRVRTFGGTPAEVPANVPLTGAFAKSSSGTHLYLEAMDDEIDTCVGQVPCRLVEAVHSPFGRQVRELAPRLTIEPGFSGTLTKRIVSDGEVLRTDPVPGVVVELKRRTTTIPERFEDTPFRGVTGPDGRYTIAAPGETRATAVAQTQPVATWAGRGTP